MAAAVLHVRLSPDQRRGEVFAPMHWTDSHASSGPIDRLTGAAVDPISGQPEFKATPLSLTLVPTLWRGFVLCRREIQPRGDEFYWARLPLERGEACELAGWSPPPAGADSETWVRRLLDAPAWAELVIYADPRRGVFRYASLVAGQLDACLFIAGSDARLPSRHELAALLGTHIEDHARGALLAGVSRSGHRAAGPTVCTCFQVGRDEIVRAIGDAGLTSVAAIGDALQAGTNCGSCIPELRQILHETAQIGAALVE